MPDTIRERVLDAFKTKLDGITGVTGLTVERNRDVRVQEFPMLIMIDGGQQANLDNTGFTRYDMNIEVEGHVTASTPGGLGDAVNALYGKTVEAVMADVTLGSLSLDIVEVSMEVEIDRGEGRKPYAAFLVTFQVTYFTEQGDPFTLGPA